MLYMYSVDSSYIYVYDNSIIVHLTSQGLRATQCGRWRLMDDHHDDDDHHVDHDDYHHQHVQAKAQAQGQGQEHEGPPMEWEPLTPTP